MKQKYFKALSEYKEFQVFLKLPFNKRTSKSVFKMLKTIIKDFFWIQTAQKLHLTKIPVVNVDHFLDEKIPFEPKKVNIYLDFTFFYIRILSMFLTKFPKEQAYKYCKQIVDFIQELYSDSGKIYSYTMTTTNRPHYKKNFRFLLIHMFDPHLLCVPSLHVTIMGGVWALVKEIFQNNDIPLTQKEKDDYLNQIYTESQLIIESVLFMKQHSVNCLAAAFYLLSAKKDKVTFTQDDANLIVSDLFKNDNNIPEAGKTEIRTYIFNLYKKMLDSMPKEGNLNQPILDLIDSFKK